VSRAGPPEAVSEGLPARGFVRQFHALTGTRKNHRVIPHHISAAHRVHADFLRCPFSNNSRASMPRHLRKLLLAYLSENFCKCFCRPARRIAFRSMMNFDNLQVPPTTEDFSGFLR